MAQARPPRPGFALGKTLDGHRATAAWDGDDYDHPSSARRVLRPYSKRSRAPAATPGSGGGHAGRGQTHFGAEAIEPVIAAASACSGKTACRRPRPNGRCSGGAAGIELHLIGPLQSNKAKEAVALFNAIHSVDRPSLCEALAKEIEKQGARRCCSSRSTPAPSRRRPACCRRTPTRFSQMPRQLRPDHFRA